MQKTATEYIPLFKSIAAEEAFQSAYDGLIESWKVTMESQWVGSDFGDTHVIVTGPVDGEPLVLIPGAQGTAGMWGPLIPKMIEKRRVYAFDIIDQVGRSRPKRILRNSHDCAQWIRQTLDGLNLSTVDIAGNSLGSFMAASFALRYPDRVRKMILTAPAATVSDISLSYLLKVLVTMALPFDGLKKRFLRQASDNNISYASPLFELLAIAMSGSKVINKVMPRALTDSELEALKMPILLIIGEFDAANKTPPAKVYDKIRCQVPDIECEILPAAGHLWSEPQFKRCGQIIDCFLENNIEA